MALLKRLSLLFLLLSGCVSHDKQEFVVAIQPIGKVSVDQIETVKHALDSAYNSRVIVLHSIEPPEAAYVNIKSPRYRADKMIAYLKEIKPDTIHYIIGLTNYDISVTKKDWLGKIKQPKSRYEDFGIFGLGYCPGKSCVVSCFRLGNDLMKSKDRLAKICVHELGHNLGLPHCENKTCVMTDAVERISTIDNAEMKLCEKCRKKM